jgi:hypothetical protein
MAPDFFANAERIYAEALERRDEIMAEWEELGRPKLERGSTGQLIEHPLVKMLREHEVIVAKLAVPLEKRHRGPDPSAVLRGVGPSKSALLRLAKSEAS